jgi:excinuclease UvrABC ATPase subunit|tara:strand:+ start:5758 stop:5901 length:144 start_codon:yes stop_codon:yes gene_type:complete
MRENCEYCNIGGVGRRSPHFKEKYGKCIVCHGLGWVDSYDVDYLVDK